MNLNIKLLFVALLALFVWACEEDLELQPEQDLSPEAAFANQDAAAASLTGAYGRMLVLDVFGSMPQIIGDFQADNVDFIGSFPTLQDIRDFLTKQGHSLSLKPSLFGRLFTLIW